MSEPSDDVDPAPRAFPGAAPAIAPGEVWLVGAGPGDPGLLTLHAARALGHADVVVHDALVSAECLALARPGAVLEHAGKRGGRPSPKQRDISLRLVELARAGHCVVRLKGGDPFVFGRGGEEALTLVRHGVPFRVVPGITAGVGGAAYAGIPVTHREVNQTVTFVTGHDAGGLVPGSIDWEAVARGSPTIVLYMAIKHMDAIASALLAAGRRPDEPVAFVCDATTPAQRTVETVLGRAARVAAGDAVAAPAIVVIGEAVRLRAGLDWLGAASGRALDPDPLGRDEALDREAG